MPNYQIRNTPTYIVVFRFLAGRHLDGDQRTDSTWLQQGERDFTPNQTASRWAYMPGWKRTAWRLGPLPFVAGNAFAYIEHPTIAVVSWSTAATGGTAYLGRKAYLRIRNFSHRRNKVRPMYVALSSRLRVSQRANPEKTLVLPHDYRTNPNAIVRLNLPKTLLVSDEDMRFIDRYIRRKVGVGATGEWDFMAHVEETDPFLEWRPAPQPPEIVPFADMRDELESADMAEIILGMGTHDRVVKINLDKEAPHVALSMPTGGGKSYAMRWILMQLSRRGFQIDIIDPKFVSQNWAVGLPGIRIHRDAASQMQCIEEFDAEMNRRYRYIGDAIDPDAFDFPRRILVIEEWNSWTPEMKAYWDEYRMSLTAKERADIPRKNPALDLVAAQLRKSRQVKMHVFGIYQRLSAQATGDNSGDMRENFGAIIMGGKVSRQTWKMLVGDTKAPKRSTVRGRSHLILGDEPVRLQIGLVHVNDAREFAMSGAVPLSTDPALTRPDNSVMAPGSGPAQEVVTRYSLAEIARKLDVNPQILYKARSRDQEFPTGTENRYTESEIRRFLRNRIKGWEETPTP